MMLVCKLWAVDLASVPLGSSIGALVASFEVVADSPIRSGADGDVNFEDRRAVVMDFDINRLSSCFDNGPFEADEELKSVTDLVGTGRVLERRGPAD